MRRSILFLVFLLAAAPLGAAMVVHRVFAIDEDGMPGTREEWDGERFQRREIVRHEHDQTITVYDGSRGWRKDWNGFVEKLAGSDLQRQMDISMLETTTIKPERGMPASSFLAITLDPATGLPSKATMPSFDGTLTVTFADWKTVDGFPFPFTETWTTGPNTTTAHLELVEIVTSIDLTPPKPGPEDVAGLKSSETLPFNFDNNHIMVQTRVNGAVTLWFLVDTGANYSVINASRIGELRLTPYGGLKTIGGGSAATSGSYVEHVTYRLGDVALRDQHAAVLELKGLERLYGMPMGGILGFDFLSRFVVDIDYVAHTLTLHPRAFDTTKLHGTHVRLYLQGEQPYFSGSITVKGEKIRSWFILDVGAADTITFTTPFIAKHDLIERAGDPERSVRKFAAPDVEAFNPTNIRGLIDAVTMGDVTLPHVFVNLSAAKTGAYTSPAFDGNIGETILSRFGHVILDYGRSAMILQTQKSTTRPFEERRGYGMSIIAGSPDLHQFTITAVGANSAAAKAGFQKGDVITAVDGVPAAQLDLAAVQRIFRADGTEHDVVVHRGAEDVKIHAAVTTAPISKLH
jgi:hypothetical protein